MNPEKPGGKRYPFRFTGSGGQYFKIWIVNIVLSILTLYIYSAWAKVRTRRYFYGNTLLDDSSFEYHARGSQILLGRIIAVVLLIGVTLSSINIVVSVIATLLLLLFMPWAVWRSLKFNARMSSYRNVRFVYSGRAIPVYGIFLVLPFLPLLILGGIAAAMYYTGTDEHAQWLLVLAIVATYLFVPMVHKISQNHILGHYQYGTVNFRARLSGVRFYLAYILAGLVAMAVPLLSLAAAIVVIKAGGLLAGQSLPELMQQLAEDNGDGPPAFVLGLGSLVYIALLISGFLAAAALRSRIRAHIYANTTIADGVRFESTVRTLPLFAIMLGNVLMLLMTLGLAYPWTKVIMARYIANNTALYSEQPLDNFINAEQTRVSALGEELGDAFDLDLDIGL